MIFVRVNLRSCENVRNFKVFPIWRKVKSPQIIYYLSRSSSHHNICNFFGIKKDKFSFGHLESFMANLSKISLSLVFYYMMLLMIVFIVGVLFFFSFFFCSLDSICFFFMLITIGPKYNSWFDFFYWIDMI